MRYRLNRESSLVYKDLMPKLDSLLGVGLGCLVELGPVVASSTYTYHSSRLKVNLRFDMTTAHLVPVGVFTL